MKYKANTISLFSLLIYFVIKHSGFIKRIIFILFENRKILFILYMGLLLLAFVIVLISLLNELISKKKLNTMSVILLIVSILIFTNDWLIM